MDKRQKFPRTALIMLLIIVGAVVLAGIDWTNGAVTSGQIPTGHSADDGHNH